MKSVFIKLAIIFLILFFYNPIHAQDSVVKKNYYVVGVGPQIVFPIERIFNTNFNSLTYNQPAYSIFYRYFFPFTSGKSVNSGNLYVTYRSADGTKNVVSSSETNHYYSKLEMCRFDLGLSRLAILGKRKGFQIGGGFGLGGLIYSSGNLKENLYRVNAYINFEMNQLFKINKNSYLLLGAKTQLESADGLGYIFGFSETPFVAYMF